jgi:hypothetical protein
MWHIINIRSRAFWAEKGNEKMANYGLKPIPDQIY